MVLPLPPAFNLTGDRDKLASDYHCLWRDSEQGQCIHGDFHQTLEHRGESRKRSRSYPGKAQEGSKERQKSIIRTKGPPWLGEGEKTAMDKANKLSAPPSCRAVLTKFGCEEFGLHPTSQEDSLKSSHNQTADLHFRKNTVGTAKRMKQKGLKLESET